MTTLLAYTDTDSVMPGDTLRVLVSLRGADSYTAQVVRLTSPEAGPNASPFAPEPVASPINGTHRGRWQRMHAGSWGYIPAHAAVERLASFTLQAFVWPTTPTRGRQAVVGCWEAEAGAGFLLALDAAGALEFRIGDGSGRQAAVATGRPLARKRWSFVSATFDAATGTMTVREEPVDVPGFHGDGPVEKTLTTALRPKAAGAMTIAAWRDARETTPTAHHGIGTAGHYNGKIERPALVSGVHGPEYRWRIASDSVLPAAMARDVVGLWDFAEGISTETIRDVSANRIDGQIVNTPARAMAGRLWDGSVLDWSRNPAHYAAIHFHDDDLCDANWQADLSFTIPAGTRSGCYSVRLTANEICYDATYFVRPPRGTRTAKVLYLASNATYIAYHNNRGRFMTSATEMYQGRLMVFDQIDLALLEHPEMGLSTYDRHSDGSGVCYSSRLRPANNVRPTGRHWNYNEDLFIIDWLEHSGTPYDVVTDEDLHREGLDLIRGYDVIVTGTHPEYDSLEMLQALEGYLSRGGRLMYMGGNGFYWRVAWHPSRRGVLEVRRTEDGVRTWDAIPGEYYMSFDGAYGGLWRRQGRAPQRLAGVGFISQGFDACSYFRCTEAAKDPRVAFMFDGVEDEIIGDFGLLQGGAAGLEIDCTDRDLGTPAHALVVARSENHSNTYEMVNEEIRVPHGMTDAVINPAIHADITFFETPGGGAVFSTGSIAYAGSLCHARFDNNIARLTSNVLRRFVDPQPFELP